MSSIVKVTDKRSGITYAYESVSYWDKEKKAPRNRRTLIGRVDNTTGEIVPTDGRRRKNMHTKDSELQTVEVHKDKGINVEELSSYTDRLNHVLDTLQSLISEVKSIQEDIQKQKHEP